MSISLWVFVSAFPPLWLVYLILINTTINLYAEQVANHWSTVFLLLLLFCVNATSYIISLSIKKVKRHSKIPIWFNNSLALAAIVPATLGSSIGIFSEYSNEFLAIISITTIAFGLGIYFGYQFKSGFLLSIIPFSIIIICSSLFIKISDNEGMFLFTSLFIIVSVTLVIKNLIHLYKKWNHGQTATN